MANSDAAVSPKRLDHVDEDNQFDYLDDYCGLQNDDCFRRIEEEYRRNKDPDVDTFNASSCSSRNFTPVEDANRREITRAIIKHEFPLHMVHHPGFIAIVRTIHPRFDLLSFNAVRENCLALYRSEKEKVLRSVQSIPGRVCLALDARASSDGMGYVVVTANFVDTDWKLQRRILNVAMEPYPNLDETAFSRAVDVCVRDWGLENKVFSLTIDHTLGASAMQTLRSQLAIKNPGILNGQLLVENCVARTFCDMALDILDEGKETVRKVRYSVAYVKTSASGKEKLAELQTGSSFSIDDTTRWDTTYQMLVTAFKFKDVFSCLENSDPVYKGAPSSDEWKQIETICFYLKILHDAANVLTTTTMMPTPVRFFDKVLMMQLELTGAAAANTDPLSKSLAERMLNRVQQYWKTSGLALATAAVMDPQFKMVFVEFRLNKIYGEETPAIIKIIYNGIQELYNEYVSFTPTAGNLRSGENHSCTPSANNIDFADFYSYIKETRSKPTKSELDRYLGSYLLSGDQDSDVMGWWKLSCDDYPVVSAMARDVFSMLVSTVSSDSVFSTVREMDSYRNSMSPDTVEALICCKDWMQ